MKTVIGMDLGDKRHFIVVLDETGEQKCKKSIANTKKQVERFFAPYKEAAVVMEAGTHSPWIGRLLESMGLEVCIGNPRKVRAIWDADDKSDERDAYLLALMYRLAPRLLKAIRHRGEQSQMHLQTIKSRQALVNARTNLINHVRGAVKSVGERVPSCSSASFHNRAVDHLPPELQASLNAVILTIETITGQIRELDRCIEQLCENVYPKTKRLREIKGVGPITALAFILTLEQPDRFAKSRQVGPYLGLTPKRDQSGGSDKQLRITKAGDKLLRQLLVTCSHYIMGPHGMDCDLRRYGERISRVGGRNAKKRAVVAVARKLAVLMHSLWRTGESYQPFMNTA